MQHRTLDAVLEEHRGDSVVVHAARTPPRPLAAFPDALPSAAADLAIGVTDAASLEDTIARLVLAVRDGGTVLVVAQAPGLLGLGASGAPSLTQIGEALLKAGIVELAAAITPGTLKKDLLVWGRALLD